MFQDPGAEKGLKYRGRNYSYYSLGVPFCNYTIPTASNYSVPFLRRLRVAPLAVRVKGPTVGVLGFWDG